MSKLLAFDWDSHEIRFVQAAQSGKSVRVLAAEAVPFDDEVDIDDPQEVGAFLRRQLDQRGLEVTAAVACISRDDVVLHELRMPEAPVDELASMVHFQATSELSLSDQESQYDYLIYPSEDDGPARAVVAVAPSRRLNAIVQAAESAGLRLRAAGLQSLARTAARQVWGPETDENTSKHGVEVLLAADTHAVEAVATRDGALLASQLVPISGENPDLGESARIALHRMGGVLGAQSPPLAAERLTVCTPPSAAWVQQLERELETPIVAFDPLEAQGAGVGSRSWGALAGLAGALAQEVAGGEAIDFLHPRRPAKPHPLRRHRWAVAAGIAALLLIGAGLRVRSNLAKLDLELDRWQTARREAAAELRRLRPYRRQHAAVANWLEGRFNWLEEYRQVLRLLPDAGDLYLTQVSFSITRSNRGLARLEGYAASEAVVASTALKLAADGRYRVRTPPIQPVSRNRNYPCRFQAELTFLPTEEAAIAGSRTRDRRMAMRP